MIFARVSAIRVYARLERQAYQTQREVLSFPARTKPLGASRGPGMRWLLLRLRALIPDEDSHADGEQPGEAHDRKAAGRVRQLFCLWLSFSRCVLLRRIVSLALCQWRVLRIVLRDLDSLASGEWTGLRLRMAL